MPRGIGEIYDTFMKYFTIILVVGIVLISGLRSCDMNTPAPAIHSEIISVHPTRSDAQQAEVETTVAHLVKFVEPSLARSYANEIVDRSHQYNLDPSLVFAVIFVESSFDSAAVSRVGAIGLMQIMPLWKVEFDSPDDNLFDYRTNIEYGCRVLRKYIDQYGSIELALQAYNGDIHGSKYQKKVKHHLILLASR